MKIHKSIIKDQLFSWWYIGLIAVLVASAVLVLSNLIRPVSAYGTDAFVITVKTDNDGTSADNEFTIPTNGDYNYNYQVDCSNDGVDDHTGATGDVTCSYPSPGTYTAVISGNFPAIYFNDSGDKLKIIDVEQWGNIEWSSFNRAFKGAANLTSSATDAPDLSRVTNMYETFRGAAAFNGDVTNWDTSNVENTSLMFYQASSFNGNVSNWNTGKVRNMSIMFCGATSFNGNLSNWDVSNVVNMNNMFCDAVNFNRDLSNWDTSKVTNMSCMFCGATAFNGDVSTWNVEKVESTESMFLEAKAFDGDLSKWKLLSLTDARYMLDYSGMSMVNYHALLNGWAELQGLPDDIEFGVRGLNYYDAGIDARQKIIDNHNWEFIDDVYSNYEYHELPAYNGEGDNSGSVDEPDGDRPADWSGSGIPSQPSKSSNPGKSSTAAGSNSSSKSKPVNNGGGSSSGAGSGQGGQDDGKTDDGHNQGSDSTTGGDNNSGNNGQGGDSEQGDVAPKRAALIKHGWDIPSVSFVANNVKEMEKMPFDGVAMSLDDLSLRDKVFNAQPLDYDDIYDAMSAAKDTKFTTMKHNFIMLYISPVGDLDNEAAWSTAVDNVGKFAKAAKASGFEGIMLDDESYWGDMVKYGDTCDDATYTVSECQALARQRGYEVMRSMQHNWNDITLLSLNGPTLGEDRTSAFYMNRGLDWDNAGADTLMGAFNVGLVKGSMGNDAKFVDGGEIYTARTKQDFSLIKYWTKQGFPMNSSYVPADLRADWSKSVSSSYGIYQDSPYDGFEFTPEIWQSTLTNAMTYADDYVWAYTEEYDWWGANPQSNPKPTDPIPGEWVDATRQAVDSFSK